MLKIVVYAQGKTDRGRSSNVGWLCTQPFIPDLHCRLYGLGGADGPISVRIESTAIPYILAEYQIEAAEFAALKSRFLIVTFFVFALNALNDRFGRKSAMLVLILLLGAVLAGHRPIHAHHTAVHDLLCRSHVRHRLQHVGDCGRRGVAGTKRARLYGGGLRDQPHPLAGLCAAVVVERLGSGLALDVRDHLYRHDPGAAAVAVHAGDRGATKR